MIEGLGEILHLFLILQMWIKPLSQLVTRIVLRLGRGAQGLNPQWLQSRGPGAKSPVVTESTDKIFSVIQEPEILLRPEPGEKIDDSGDESGD